MKEYLADTHAFIWHRENSPRLSAAARACFDSADQGASRIYLATISIVEMTYLGERGKIPANLATDTMNRLAGPIGSYVLVPLDEAVLAKVSAVSRTLVPDLPDRIITATALSLNVPLITVDEVITRSGLVDTVW